jgi:hypothetical protein
VSDHFPADIEFDAELRVGQGFLDPAFDFDRFFLGHGASAGKNAARHAPGL